MNAANGQIRVGAIDLHYARRGEGRTVVLINDTPWSSALYAPLVETLADRFCVVALDLPGYGRSPAPSDWEALEVSRLAQTLWDALAALGVMAPALYARPSAGPLVLRMAARADRLAVAIIDAHAAPVAADALDGPSALGQADPVYLAAYADAMRRAAAEGAITPALAPVRLLAAPDDTWTSGPVFPVQPLPAGCLTQHLPDDRALWRQALVATFAAGFGEAG